MSGRETGEVGVDIADHTALIDELYEHVLTPEHGFRSYPLGAPEACRQLGLDQVRRAADCVVLGEDAAVQLGSPQRRSLSCAMWSHRRGCVGNRLWLAGPELGELRGEEASLGYLVMAELAPPTAATVETVETAEPAASQEPDVVHPGSLAGRVPGLMARRMPGKLWLRIHTRLLGRGLTLYGLGQCLGAACSAAATPGPGSAVQALDVALFIGDEPAMARIFEQVEPLVEAAQLLRRKRQQLRWNERGWVGCSDLNCETCDDRPACDLLRDVVVARRRGPTTQPEKRSVS